MPRKLTLLLMEWPFGKEFGCSPHTLIIFQFKCGITIEQQRTEATLCCMKFVQKGTFLSSPLLFKQWLYDNPKDKSKQWHHDKSKRNVVWHFSIIILGKKNLTGIVQPNNTKLKCLSQHIKYSSSTTECVIIEDYYGTYVKCFKKLIEKE